MSSALPIVDGRRFGCTQCGACCRQDGWVYVTTDEVARMAAHLGLTVGQFWADFAVMHDPDADQPVLEAKDGKGCPLLTADGRCRVHAVKPVQCSTFPFWSDLLDDALAWDYAKTYCPGMDEGRLYSRSEIFAIRDGQTKT